MAQQNLTIWQRLGSIFKDPQPQLKQTSQYNFDTKELLKTQNKEEYELEKLQKQQSIYLHNQWQKVDSEMYQQAVFYETTRIAAYTDFESMEFYPELSAALDIMMEESCLYSNTKIPLLNGKTETIEDLYKNNMTNFWVYSVDVKDNEIKPSIVEKVIFKGIKDTYKITLDDNTEIICTDNHLWLDYNNKWVETKDLKIGNSLKSVYKKYNYKGYEKISLNNFHKDFQFTHILVAENKLKKEKELLENNDRSKNEKIVIHHKSFNKLNNEPSQLFQFYRLKEVFWY